LEHSESQAVHLPAVIEKAIRHTRNLLGDKAISVVAESPAHLPAVEVDEGRLQQILTSLVVCVTNLSAQDQIRVRSELLPVDLGIDLPAEKLEKLQHRGMWAMVSIADVPPEVDLPSLAAPIFSLSDLVVEEARREVLLDYEGCSTNVDELGGVLWSEGRLGSGVRIRLALPLRAEKSPSADLAPLRRAVDARFVRADESPKSLLLMVEEQSLGEMLSQELLEAGYQVLLTEAAAEVPSIARRETPDLILLDLMARDPNALDVALVLKRDRRTQQIPVLFLTSVQDPQQALQMDAVDFLVRPVGTGALLATVNAVLGAGLSPRSRLLVVEPDEVARENIVMMIQAHGFRVAIATGSEEALALAERVEPSLVLVNASLAQERDYFLLRGLKRISTDTEIFVMADALSEEEGRAAVTRGASGYSETGRLRELLDRVKGDTDRLDREKGER
jgi:DNA-binding response OmpR family regulator